MVWVDAVCINQADNTEKSLQVRHMKQIYEQGATTISWLGRRDNDMAELAIKFLLLGHDKVSPLIVIERKGRRRGVTFSEIQKEYSKHQLLCIDNLRQSNGSFHDDVILDIIRNGLRPSTNSTGNACYSCALRVCFLSLIDLFKRPYWKRRWIVQEITASPQVNLICGNSKIDIRSLEEVINSCRESPYWERGHTLASKHYRSMMLLRQKIRTEELSLAEAIVETSDFLSKDVRDKIYSLIGIMPEGPQLVPMPNYYQPPTSAAVHLTRALIKKSGSLDLIWSDDRMRDPTSSLPTWAPDWLSSGLKSETVKASRKRATKNWDTLPQALTLWCLESEDLNVLRLQGVLLCTITAISTSTGCKAGDGDIFQAAAGHQSGLSRQYYKTSWRLLQAIIKCAVLQLSSDPEKYDDLATDIGSPALHFFLSNLQSYLRKDSRTHRPDLKYAAKAVRAYQLWLHRNQGLQVAGKSLQCWLMQSPVAHAVIRVCWSPTGFLLSAVISIAFVIAHAVTGDDKVNLVINIALCLHLALIMPLFLLFRWNYLYSVPSVPSANNMPTRMVITDTGMLGQVTSFARLGDKICFFAGCTRAVVMREIERSARGTRYQIVRAGFCSVNDSDLSRLRLWRRAELEKLWAKRMKNYKTQGLRESGRSGLVESWRLTLEQCQRESWWMEFVVV
jgi:hypothetical protein